MGFLKVHIIHGQEIHLEGESSVVLDILDKYSPLSHPLIPPKSSSTLPPLQNSVVKALAKSEAEWLLIFAGYFDHPHFTRHDLLLAYRSTGRHSANHTKNLSFNIKICLKHNWFTAITQNTYTLSDQGHHHFQEILARNP